MSATPIPTPPSSFTGRTAWARNLEAPLRLFLATETGGAAILLAASVIALIWVNIDAGSYDRVWNTVLSVRIGGASVSLPLRQWVNEGLMSFFFLVVALEARWEFDLGELRDRRRLLLPAIAAVGGMLFPVGIYLAFNAGESSVDRLGGGDVHRHRVRARDARSRRPSLPAEPPGLHPDRRRRRRPRLVRRDRRRSTARRSGSSG